METSGIANADVNDLEQRIKDGIPKSLQYSRLLGYSPGGREPCIFPPEFLPEPDGALLAGIVEPDW